MSKHKRFPMRIPRYGGGIRVQDLRGGAGESWWGRRWRDSVEEKSLAGRYGRARNYALSGQVREVAFSLSRVTAKVLGLRKDPYSVTLDFSVPQGKARERIVSGLKGDPMSVARLLADELPMEVEDLFRSQGCCLFPGGKLPGGGYDVTTTCSCPDYANPCKHSLAVLLVVGEEVSRHPWRLLELRGIRTDEILPQAIEHLSD